MPVAKIEDFDAELEAFALPGSPPPDSDDSNDDSNSGTLVNSSEPSVSPEPFNGVSGPETTALKTEEPGVNFFSESRSEMRGDNPDSHIALDFSDEEDEEAAPDVGNGDVIWDEETTNEARSRIKALQNPKMEVKKDFDPDAWPVQTIARFIDGIPELEVNAKDVDIDFSVPRPFLSTLFGGSFVSTYPRRSKKMQAKLIALGFDNCQWACLKAGYNPYMPTIPGKPGLAFDCESSELIDIDSLQRQPPERLRVIVCLSSKNWLYVGQYDRSFIFCLSKEEWLGLPLQVKRSWAGGICKMDWGRILRIKVFLRNRPAPGRMFTQAQFEQLQADGTRSFECEITEQQVIDSFDRGEMHIIIHKMRCVGYELEFQRKLEHDYSDWAEEEKKKEAAKKRTQEGNKSKEGKGEPHKKKRRLESTRPSVDAAEYVPTGTKSRPKTSGTRKPAKARS
ncbi:hypothetical protein PQX77_004061 [Marasmius sp. AFHP31]|nr:hypothetical protein PQX77_004061 [Marasmius sp. AFHP31]